MAEVSVSKLTKGSYVLLNDGSIRVIKTISRHPERDFEYTVQYEDGKIVEYDEQGKTYPTQYLFIIVEAGYAEVAAPNSETTCKPSIVSVRKPVVSKLEKGVVVRLNDGYCRVVESVYRVSSINVSVSNPVPVYAVIYEGGEKLEYFNNGRCIEYQDCKGITFKNNLSIKEVVTFDTTAPSSGPAMWKLQSGSLCIFANGVSEVAHHVHAPTEDTFSVTFQIGVFNYNLNGKHECNSDYDLVAIHKPNESGLLNMEGITMDELISLSTPSEYTKNIGVAESMRRRLSESFAKMGAHALAMGEKSAISPELQDDAKKYASRITPPSVPEPKKVLHLLRHSDAYHDITYLDFKGHSVDSGDTVMYEGIVYTVINKGFTFDRDGLKHITLRVRKQ